MERKRNMEPKLNNGQLVEAFASYLEVEKDDSPLTIANYEADIRHFTDFMATRSEDASWPAITVLDIRSYLALMHDAKLARRTIARPDQSVCQGTDPETGKEAACIFGRIRNQSAAADARCANCPGPPGQGDPGIPLFHRLPGFRTGGTYYDPRGSGQSVCGTHGERP